jgi:release factor glutamine methyltransferase
MAAMRRSRSTELITGSALLQWRRRCLQAGGSAAELDWLLEMAGGLSWTNLQMVHLRPEHPLELLVPLQELTSIWERHRRERIPLQYLVGICPWRDLEISVAPGVLIPRQETELLVDLAVEVTSRHAPPANRSAGPALWADLGTGSACMAVALARSWPDSRGLAVDVSPEALHQAEANLRRYELHNRVTLKQGSWWAPIRNHRGQLELVVSNPPYIPTGIWRELEPLVRCQEPELALDGGSDGLAAIRSIADEAAEMLAPGGWLVLEHHHDQSQSVLALLRTVGLEQGHAGTDLEGKQRFALARRPLQG